MRKKGRPGEHPWPEDYLEALAKPVRLTVSFDSLPKTKKPIAILNEAVEDTGTVLYDAELSQ